MAVALGTVGKSTKSILSSQDVADKYGVEVRDVLYAVRRGMIKGQKIGWAWIFDLADLPAQWPVRKRRKA